MANFRKEISQPVLYAEMLMFSQLPAANSLFLQGKKLAPAQLAEFRATGARFARNPARIGKAVRHRKIRFLWAIIRPLTRLRLADN